MRIELEPRGDVIDEDMREFVRRVIYLNRSQQREIDRGVRREFAHSFSAQGNARPWASLAQMTIIDRIRKGYPGISPILIRSGDFMRSWTERSHPDHVFDFNQQRDGWTIESGSEDERAQWHEQGTRFMPARPVADFSVQSENRLRSVVDALIDRIWEKSTNR